MPYVKARLNPSLMALLAVPFFTLADNSNPTGEPNDELFDYAFGYTPKEEQAILTTECDPNGSSPKGCAIEQCKNTEIDTLVNGYGDVRTYQSISLIDSNPDDSGTAIYYVYKCTTKQVSYFNGTVNRTTYPTFTIALTGAVTLAKTCPPENENYATATYRAKVGDTELCFIPADLNSRDSCPDSTSDGSYLLPVTSDNSDSSVCLVRPDGSRCEYDKVGDVYVTDFENSCYQNQYPEYDETGLNLPDQEGAPCQDIGNGISACLEDPLNVCTDGVCQSGCGTMAISEESAFVCLSGDTDGDGIGDYVDPDVDGDGIPNEQDLDFDGDGIDDPTYENPGHGQTISLAGVERRLDEIKSKIPELDNIGEVTPVDKGSYPTQSEIELEIEEAELELKETIEQIKSEVDALFTLPEVNGTFIDCMNIIQVNGSTHQTCAGKFEDEMQIVSYAILFLFALISVIIILR